MSVNVEQFVVSLIPNSEQRDCLIYAFRYALGRRSYAPHTIIGILASSWPDISAADRQLYKREIEQAIKDGRAGMAFDEQVWRGVLELPDS